MGFKPVPNFPYPEKLFCSSPSILIMPPLPPNMCFSSIDVTRRWQILRYSACN